MNLRLAGLAIAALVGAAACTCGASAADLVVGRGGVEAPPAFSWSGFYAGVHGGYGWSSSVWTLTSTMPPDPFPIVGTKEQTQASGVLGGIQFGFNHQFGNWVAGLEADLSLINSDGSATASLPGTLSFATARSQTNWLTTLTARTGYAFDRSLVYVKGGLAGAEFKDSYSVTDVVGNFIDFGSQTDIRLGWAIGAGYEYAILDNWTARIEYEYLDFGVTKDAFTTLDGAGGIVAAAQWDQSITHRLQQLQAGFNYKF